MQRAVSVDDEYETHDSFELESGSAPVELLDLKVELCKNAVNFELLCTVDDPRCRVKIRRDSQKCPVVIVANHRHIRTRLHDNRPARQNQKTVL